MFLATDVERSTWLWSRHPEEMAAASARHDVEIASIFTEHGGVVVRRLWEGDSTFASFEDPRAALAAAMAVHDAVGRVRVGGSAVAVRVALHAAECDSPDLFPGAEVNKLLRLKAVGNGGQTIATREAADAIGGAAPEAATASDLGWHRLSYGSKPMQLFQLDRPGSMREFPALTTLDSSPNNLPSQLTTFIGRSAERAAVKLALDASDLVVLTGMPGAGKSRLAHEVGAEMLGSFPRGVWVMGPGDHNGEREEGPGSLMIVDGHAESGWRFQAGTKVIATDLHVDADPQSIVAVGPLPLSDDEEPSGGEAVRLFMDRAQERYPDAAADHLEMGSVAELCARCFGNPLAIETIVRLLAVLTPSAIVSRWSSDPDLLWGSRAGGRSASSLHAAFERALSRVSPQEREVLAGTSSDPAASALVAARGWGRFVDGDLVPHLAWRQFLDRAGTGG